MLVPGPGSKGPSSFCFCALPGRTTQAVQAAPLGSEAMMRRAEASKPTARTKTQDMRGKPSGTPVPVRHMMRPHEPAWPIGRRAETSRPSQVLPTGKPTQVCDSPSCRDTSVRPCCSSLRSDRNWLAVHKFHFLFFLYFSGSLKGRGGRGTKV